MAGRRDRPPPRPPAPRTAIDKLKSSHTNSGPSIAIRFNAMNDDDDDDEDLFSVTGFNTRNEVLKFEKSGVGSVFKNEPRSAPGTPLNSKVNSGANPPPRPTQLISHKTESKGIPRSSRDLGSRSLFGDLKEKISDKISDPLNVISKKLEELSPSSQPGEEKDTIMSTEVKKESAPTFSSPSSAPTAPTASVPEGQLVKIDNGTPSTASTQLSSTDQDLVSRGFKVASTDPLLPSKQDNPVNKSPSCSGSLGSDITVNESNHQPSPIQMVDDFFDDPPEDFFGDINVSTNRLPSVTVTPQPTPKPHPSSGASTVGLSKSLNTKEDSEKGTPIKRSHNPRSSGSVAMSMSSLLSKPDNEEEELYLENKKEDKTIEPEKTQKMSRAFPDVNNPVITHKSPSNLESSEPVLDKVDSVVPQAVRDEPATDLPRPVPVMKIVVSTLSLFLYFIIPWPPYFAGFLMGMTVACCSIFAYLWLMKPKKPREPFTVPNLEDLVPDLIPEIKESKSHDGIFRGWMNELTHYDPEDYHINLTHSIYVSLEGTTLRLQRPKNNIPKRAMWDEPQPSPKFIHQRYYDVRGCKVTLLPPELVKKRLWSKKYPICLTLKSPSSAKGDKKSCESRSSPSKLPKSRSTSPLDSCDDDTGKQFELVTKEICDEVVLFLFARTSREKEEWYRRFQAAGDGHPLVNHLAEAIRLRRSSSAEFHKHRRQSSADSLLSNTEPGMKEMKEMKEVGDPYQQIQSDYIRFLARVMPSDNILKTAKSSSIVRKEGARYGYIVCEPQLISINSLISRIFWDFLREKHWAEKVAEKIQKKLSKIRVPFFINELTITDIELGTEMPVIRRAYKPYLDERGLWIDADIAYGGGFRMTLETKVNLMKLKKNSADVSRVEQPRDFVDNKRSAVTHSDEEDSVESSTDEDAEENPPLDTTDDSGVRGGGTSKKFLRILDKVTQSKYFQQATENKYIKRAMEGVSNTRLLLSVEVQSLVGKLAVNIPPPPTDRFWYGFRTNPRLWLSATPQVGERTISVTHITDWIEKKLALEFQKVFVLPNMDDLPVLIMNQGTVHNGPMSDAD